VIRPVKRALPYAVFAAVTLAAFWKFIFLGWTLVDVRLYESILGRPRREAPGWFERNRPAVERGDTLLLLPVPLRIYSEGLKSGELRLWNPSLFCGSPVASDPIVQPFYPPNLLLHALLPPLAAYEVSLMLHLFFTGASMFWLLRGLGRSAPAATAGGLLWMLGGYNALWVSAGFMAGALVFGPLALLGVVRALERRDDRPAALGGAAMGMVILGSHPQHALFLLVFLGAWLLAAAVRDRGNRRGVIRAGAVFALFAVGAGFAAILAHLETVAHCFRAPGRDIDLIYDRPFAVLTHLAGLFLGKVHVSSNPLVRSELTVFIGLAGTALAAAGAVRCFRDPSARFIALFGAAALLVAFVRPLVEVMLLVPIANLSMPSRWVFVAGFCLAVLAAYGLDALEKEARRVPHVLAGAACLFAGACAVGAGPFRFSNGAALETLAGFALAAGAAWALPRSAAAGRALGLAAILVDLLPGFLVLNAHADPAPLRETPEAVRFARGLGEEPWRATGGLRDPAAGPATANVWTVSTGNNLLALHGVEAAAGYEAAPPATFVRYCVEAGGIVAGSGRVLAFGDLESRLLDAANVKYVFLPFRLEVPKRYRKRGEWGALQLYENPAALPRARVVGCVLAARGPDEAAEFLRNPGFDPSTMAVLEGPGDLPRSAGPVNHRVRWLERGADRVRLEVEADGDGVLVLSETDYPGWRAEVDGVPVPVRRADLTFRAVALRAGKRVVEFRFRPGWLLPGLLGSFLSLAGALGWGLVRRRGAECPESPARSE